MREFIARLRTLGERSAAAGDAPIIAFAFLFWLADRQSPGPVRLLLLVLAGFAFLATLILSSGRLSRAFESAAGRSRLTEPRLFWSGFGLILLLGVAARVILTSAIRLPLVMPDSFLYVITALGNPLFPISDARPVGFPYLIVFSLSLFRQPLGILITHNVLALLSGSILVIALRKRCGMGATALLMFVYVLFAEKNLEFEYLALTEHLSRVLYILFVAALLLYWGSREILPQVLLGLLAVLNILTKTSAIVLIPTYFVWRLMDPAVGRSWSRLVKASAAFAATVVILLGIYGAAGYRRLGFLPFSSMTGHALYYHVNPLTVTEGGEYPEIKSELRRFFPRYLEKYWSRGVNLGNWAIWGITESSEVAHDFGSQSPANAVKDYIRRHPSGPRFPQKDRIFRDLSYEAIRSHPARYIALSIDSLRELIVDGLSFSYDQKPFSESPAYAKREYYLRDWFRIGRTDWTVERLEKENDPRAAKRLFGCVQEISRILRTGFLAIAIVSPLLLAILIVGRNQNPASANLLRVVVVLSTLVGLYLILLALVCPGEQQRYVSNIQDVIVLLPFVMASGAWRSVRSLPASRA